MGRINKLEFEIEITKLDGWINVAVNPDNRPFIGFCISQFDQYACCDISLQEAEAIRDFLTTHIARLKPERVL